MKKNVILLILFFSVSLFPAVYAHATDADSKVMLLDIKKDLADIKMMLGAIMGVPGAAGAPGAYPVGATAPYPGQVAPGRPPENQEATTSTDDDPVLGDHNAPVTIVEFSDYECSFCARFAKETLSKIKEKYINTGKVKLVYRDFPLDFHPNAMPAAIAANCAGEQGKYFGMHDAIFVNQTAVSDLVSIASKVPGLDMAKFKECLSEGKYTGEVSKDIMDGRAIGVMGTPTFVIGKTRPDGTVTGKIIPGALPYNAFVLEIEALLAK